MVSGVKTDLCTVVHKNTKLEEIRTERQLRELNSAPSESLAEVIGKATEIADFWPHCCITKLTDTIAAGNQSRSVRQCV